MLEKLYDVGTGDVEISKVRRKFCGTVNGKMFASCMIRNVKVLYTSRITTDVCMKDLKGMLLSVYTTGFAA